MNITDRRVLRSYTDTAKIFRFPHGTGVPRREIHLVVSNRRRGPYDDEGML